MSDLVKTDTDMDLIEALESRFSLHDVDMIYNLCYSLYILDVSNIKISLYICSNAFCIEYSSN